MKLVFDTNAYCLCDLGNEKALSFVETATSLFMPIIVYGELYFGFKHGKKYDYNIKRLDKFIQTFDVELISVDVDVAKKFGDIYSSLKKRETPIPTNDIWIAACCMSMGGVLLTNDKHFQIVEQIQSEFI